MFWFRDRVFVKPYGHIVGLAGLNASFGVPCARLSPDQ